MWVYDLDEKQSYILAYFQHLLTENERKALSAFFWQDVSNNTGSLAKKEVIRKRLLAQGAEVIKTVEGGFEKFADETVERLLEESKEKVFLNYCPKCSALARTPNAKQCPKCFYSWHEEN